MTTQEVSEINTTTATGNGTLTDVGFPDPTQHGVLERVAPDPEMGGPDVTCSQEGAPTSTGPFSSAISGLSADTTYHVRAYATNETGTAYGDDVSFQTDPEPATVTTQDVSGIGTTTATGNGDISYLGAPAATQHGVCWSLSPTPGPGRHLQPGRRSGLHRPFYLANYRALPQPDLLRTRLRHTNTADTVYGNEVSFNANPNASAVTTDAVSEISTTTSVANGTITALGIDPSSHGFCWNTDGNPTIGLNCTDEGVPADTGAFSSNITTLTAYTDYYVKAYVTDASGIVYGNQVQFTTGAQAPIVATEAVSDITPTSAVGNGTLSDLGIPDPTQHGLCWNTTGNPTTADTCTDKGAVADTGAFASDLTGLVSGTTYHVRAYATNTADTVYGDDVSFTTYKPPAVSTQAVSDIGASTAVGTQPPLTRVFPQQPSTVRAGTPPAIPPQPTPVRRKAPLLRPVRSPPALAISNQTAPITYAPMPPTRSTRFTVTRSISTTYQLPTVVTLNMTDIGATTATGSGNITTLGVPNPTAHGVCWNTSVHPQFQMVWRTMGAAAADGTFTASMTELIPGSTYYVRAYATNAAGTAYGDTVMFETLPALPVVATQEVSEINTTTATGNGNILDLGGPNPTHHGMCWSQDPEPTLSDTCSTEGEASSIGVFTSNITGLLPNLTYHVRAYATNTLGTAYGNDLTFSTNPSAPSVSTQGVSGVTATTATGNGTIVEPGVPYATQHGVCWSTGVSPTTADDRSQKGDATEPGGFTAAITGLTPDTTYYVRAFATNTVDTAYGTAVSFTTPKQVPTVTTQDVTGITTTAATGKGTLVDLGVPEPTAHGICWDTASNPTIGGSHKDLGAPVETGAFTAEITGLVAGTTYYVRAFAVNATGTAYGEEVSLWPSTRRWSPPRRLPALRPHRPRATAP